MANKLDSGLNACTFYLYSNVPGAFQINIEMIFIVGIDYLHKKGKFKF